MLFNKMLLLACLVLGTFAVQAGQEPRATEAAKKVTIVSLVRADGIQVKIELTCWLDKESAEILSQPIKAEYLCKLMAFIHDQVVVIMQGAGFDMTPEDYLLAKKEPPRKDVAYHVELSTKEPDRIRYMVRVEKARHLPVTLDWETANAEDIAKGLERLHQEALGYFVPKKKKK